MADKVSGIYAIHCRVGDYIYIGQSVDVYMRWHQHRSGLRRGKPTTNRRLRHLWNKYGEDVFSFVLLESCLPERDVLWEREQHWLDCVPAHKQLNSRAPAGTPMLGVTHSAETRAKLSMRHKGRRTDCLCSTVEASLGNLSLTFPSIREASAHFAVDGKAIPYVLKGRQTRSPALFGWSFKVIAPGRLARNVVSSQR